MKSRRWGGWLARDGVQVLDEGTEKGVELPFD